MKSMCPYCALPVVGNYHAHLVGCSMNSATLRKLFVRNVFKQRRFRGLAHEINSSRSEFLKFLIVCVRCFRFRYMVARHDYPRCSCGSPMRRLKEIIEEVTLDGETLPKKIF